MKALVTGASGFIGSTLVEELNTLGFEVKALLRASSSTANLKNLVFERVNGSLDDLDSLRRALTGVDYVFHLAGVTTARDKSGYFAANTLGTENLARAVADVCPSLSRFVFVSSMAAGGPANSLTPKKETDRDDPVSFYGQSKHAAEDALLRYKDQFPISILRPPMVYGPRDKNVFLFIQSVAKNLMPILKGSSSSGHKYYSAIHSKDLSRAIVQAALVSVDRVPSGEKFYICGEGFFSYEEIMGVISERLNRAPLRIPVPSFLVKVAAYGSSAVSAITGKSYPLSVDKLNELIPDYWICSNEKAKEQLDFVPEFDLKTGMSDAIEWYQENSWL